MEKEDGQTILQVELPVTVSGTIKVRGVTKQHSGGKLKMIEETRANINQMFNFKQDRIDPEGMHGGWQTSGTVRVPKKLDNLTSI